MNDYSLSDFSTDVRCVVKSLAEIQAMLFQSDILDKSKFNGLMNDSIGSLSEIYDKIFDEEWLDGVWIGLDE